MDLPEAVRILCGEFLLELAKTKHQEAQALGVLLAYVDAKCVQSDCPQEARSRVFWPGRSPARMCTFHRDAAIAVATCMGFPLHVENVQ